MTQDIHAEKILILDFGSQYTQLIARRVREANVYCEIYAWDVTDEQVRAFNPNGVILSGGPESVTAEQGPRAPKAVFELGVPVLGICYGMQTMAAQLGGEVETSEQKEFGYARVRARGHSRLFTDIQDHVNDEGHGLLDVWMSHGDRVATLPDGFKVIATTDSAPLAGMADDDRGYYGIQFHPEVTHTAQGKRILSRFVHEICGCGELWTSEHIIEDLVERIQKVLSEQVKEVKVTKRLTESPACLVVGDYDMGQQMRKIMEAAGQPLPDAKPIFEINVDHPLLQRLEKEQGEEGRRMAPKRGRGERGGP